MLNGDLCSDIIGTSPEYPPIVDHSWLDVDLTKYDNYPSDNNSVRIVPKLHDLWSHAAAQTGANLIPNSQVTPLGIRSSEEDVKAVDQVVKEAKKAVMAGLKGKKLSEHIRARFASKHVGMAQGALKKVAEEVGLLGNVYIDASAFNSYNEAEQFMSQHRNRLAQDILLDTVGVNSSVIMTLASTFHKNVVASVVYNEALLSKYRDFLVQSNRIPSDMVVASKEDLRKAFLYVASKPEEKEPAKIQEKVIDPEKVKEAMAKANSDQAIKMAEDRDSVLISKISPIASFVQENLAKGKTAGSIKEMVRTKYALVDLKDASEALGVVLSKDGLSEGHLDDLIKEGKISLVMGTELKKIGKKFPVKEIQKFAGEVLTEHSVGTPGFLYSLQGNKVEDKNEIYRKASIEALKKGFDLEAIKAKLLKKLSADEANQVLLEAINMANAMPAGCVANKVKKQEKVMVEGPAEKVTLPDPKTIEAQTQEILATFEGCTMDVSIDAAQDFNAVDIEDLFNRSGLDETII